MFNALTQGWKTLSMYSGDQNTEHPITQNVKFPDTPLSCLFLVSPIFARRTESSYAYVTSQGAVGWARLKLLQNQNFTKYIAPK